MLRTNIAVGAFAAAFAFAAPAIAADMPQPDYSKAPVVQPAPQTFYDWTGVYAGLNAGYAWGDFEGDGIDPAGAFGGDFDGDGFIGGATLGANWQFDQFVFGVEGDFNFADISGSTTFGVAPATVGAETNWLSTVRGRAGIAIDNILIYGTGGVAFADVDSSYAGPGGVGSDSNTHTGWTAGAGVEVGMTPNLSVKAEYLYVDLGDESYNYTPTAAADLELDSHIVRAGLNYRFNLFQ